MLTNPPNYYVALPRKASESGGGEPPVVITGVPFLGVIGIASGEVEALMIGYAVDYAGILIDTDLSMIGPAPSEGAGILQDTDLLALPLGIPVGTHTIMPYI